MISQRGKYPFVWLSTKQVLGREEGIALCARREATPPPPSALGYGQQTQHRIRPKACSASTWSDRRIARAGGPDAQRTLRGRWPQRSRPRFA